MENYIQADDYELWMLIKNGPCWENSSFKIYKTPSARYIVVYLGCRPQGVVF